MGKGCCRSRMGRKWVSRSWSFDGVTSVGYEDMHGRNSCLVRAEDTMGLLHLGLCRRKIMRPT